MKTKKAFTLAEVLITLGIIGVVAAITMPILITNMTERKNSERHANIAYKVTQAMEHMRATGKLVQYDSTESFVNELKKHLKIAKICDKDHLTDCWPTETVTNRAGEEYNVADAKTGKELGLATETNNVGLVLADGAVMILNYNPDTPGMDVGDRVKASFKELPVGNGKMKSFAYTSTVTGPIDFIMDVNGKSKPNKEPESDSKQYDIRSLTSATFTTTEAPFVCTGETGTKGCVKYIGYEYTAVSCESTSEYYTDTEICGEHPSGLADDRWAGAKAKCKSIAGMHLPTIEELQAIQAVRAEYLSIASATGWFWSSDEYSTNPRERGGYMNISSGSEGYGDFKSDSVQVLCVGD